jgi:CubicO group peptidase (beta-lactamase class C family)
VRILKKVLLFLLLLLLALNLFIIFSGKTYLYMGVANTYFKGRSGPSIEEYKIFENREVKNGNYQPWPKSVAYNKIPVPSQFMEEYKKMGTIAYVIIKNDSLLHEEYWDGFGENSITNSFSMAKTFVSILIGIAIKDGYIKSVDQPVGDFLPHFKQGDNAKITIKHLLSMSSGIDFDEDYVSPFAYPAEAYYGSDLEKLTYKYKARKEPGRGFEYLSGNTAVLSFVLKKATGKTLSEYASEKLWQPIGAKKSAFWSLDHENGNEKAYCCFNSNATDFARFGQLYLKGGNWKGQQIVPEEYVKESVVPADLVDSEGKKNNRYGYSWWLLPNYNGHNIFYARGILGQYIIVIPDKNMVVVRLGKKREKRQRDEHPIDLFTYIDAALQMQ